MKYAKGTSGLELIAIERDEQINKHGFSLEHDKESYEKEELVQAAKYCLQEVGVDGITWLEGWGQEFKEKVDAKDQTGKLIVAGALYQAENERRGDNFYESDVNDCATAIDSIIQNS